MGEEMWVLLCWSSIVCGRDLWTSGSWGFWWKWRCSFTFWGLDLRRGRVGSAGDCIFVYLLIR